MVRSILSAGIACLLLSGVGIAQTSSLQSAANRRPTFAPGELVGLAPGQSMGQIGQVEGLRLLTIGAADVFGNGPYDLFLGGPGLFRCAGFDGNGQPIYAAPVPLSDHASVDVVVTGRDGTIYGIAASGRKLRTTRFDRQSLRFVPMAESTNLDVPRGMSGHIAAWIDPRDRLHVYFAIGDGLPLRHDENHHAATFLPYDGAGFWRGNIPRLSLYHARFNSVQLKRLEHLARASEGPGEFLFQMGGMSVVTLGNDRPPGLAAADKMSTIRYFPLDPATGTPGPMGFLNSPQGVALRHPVINASLKSIPDRDTGYSNLIVTDTCRSWFYRFNNEWTADGNPVFIGPTPLMAENAHLSLGALCVLSPGDMDEDGRVDLMVGNDAGQLLFVRNVGNAAAAAFDQPVEALVGGRPLEIKAGYNGSIQGPQEAMWGYTCPVVRDWNGDGRPDVILNSILGDYLVVLRNGSPHEVSFAEPRPLYCDGLQLHLAWRCQPAITDWGQGNRLCLIALDEQNLLRMFWRIDDENLARGDLLRLKDGSSITANVDEFAGQTGRAKLVACDWDADGAIDLLIGTSRGLSFPASKSVYYPSDFGETRASSVLLLRNIGTNEKPVFDHVRLIEFEGERIKLGIHSCSPALVDVGRGVEDLLVGTELGSVRYYPRESLTVSAPATD